MKLHLGCGERYLEGFTHIDIADFEHIDFKIPVNDLSIFEEDSVELIYASHVIEYFDPFEVINVLGEWKRVLTPGGTLRIAVPNFSSLIKIYDQTGEIDKILGPLYGRWSTDNDEFIYHKTVYDQKSLTRLLDNCGYVDIQEWDWRKVFKNTRNYDDHSQAYFPHMDKVNGIHVSLNLECKK